LRDDEACDGGGIIQRDVKLSGKARGGSTRRLVALPYTTTGGRAGVSNKAVAAASPQDVSVHILVVQLPDARIPLHTKG
jgi:hypothetical protein